MWGARQNGKTAHMFRTAIEGTRREPGATVYLMCHPDDHERVSASLALVLAADPSLQPVVLQTGWTVWRGSIFTFRDLDEVPPAHRSRSRSRHLVHRRARREP
jgi:hypothetical protein